MIAGKGSVEVKLKRPRLRMSFVYSPNTIQCTRDKFNLVEIRKKYPDPNPESSSQVG